MIKLCKITKILYEFLQKFGFSAAARTKYDNVLMGQIAELKEDAATNCVDGVNENIAQQVHIVQVDVFWYPDKETLFSYSFCFVDNF